MTETDTARPGLAAAAIALALGFNAPYAALAVTFNYPAVLRLPAGEALDLFAARGLFLVLTWHAFALAALALAPLAVFLALTPRRVREAPALAIGAAILGALAGVTQAIGLWRWVFVTPALAGIHADPGASEAARAGAEATFDVLNAYGGVAIGEHLGQWLTAMFAASLGALQWREGAKVNGALGLASAALIVVGAQEGVAMALDRASDVFSYFTIAGFLALAVWLIGTGLGLFRAGRPTGDTARKALHEPARRPHSVACRKRRSWERMMSLIQIEVRRDALAQTRIRTAPLPALNDGEVLARVVKFALTANNVTYGFAGDSVGYWNFFPTEAPYGIIPVWGFAEIVESRCAGLDKGERFWGFLPMASHVVLRPGDISRGAFVDAAAHRAALPGLYNRYARTGADDSALASLEDERCVYFPLFTTSYVLYDYLSDNAYFGAKQVVIGSASSKTGFGLAYALRRLAPGAVRVIGLTSARNLAFVRGLDIYDDVRAYDDLKAIENAPTAFIDMAGDGAVTAALDDHLGENITLSCGVGVTHWTAARAAGPFKGAAPRFFFAPGQIGKREAEWGPGEMLRRANVENIRTAAAIKDKLAIDHVNGAEAAMAAYRALAEGKAAPERAMMLSLSDG